MPDDYDTWYKKSVDSGILPDENGYYHYIKCDDSYYSNVDLVEILENEYLTDSKNSDIINM